MACRSELTTVIRLADDTTRQITIRQAAGCQWVVVTIDGAPVKRCKRGHVLIRQTAAIDRDGYLVCKICKRASDRRWYLAHREAKKKAVRRYHHTVRMPRKRERRRARAVDCG